MATSKTHRYTVVPTDLHELIRRRADRTRELIHLVREPFIGVRAPAPAAGAR
jgi:hypothetical protein